MKLGRKAVKTDSRTLQLGDYLSPALPPPPPVVDWTKGKTEWGMMLNGPNDGRFAPKEGLGDCTIAGAAHAVQVWSLANVGLELTVADKDILKAYEQWDGYNPHDPSTDQGGIELDVLNRWKKSSLAGHALLAFADVKVSNIQEAKQAISLFGGLYIGMQVPNFVMQDPQPSKVWDVVADDGGIDGGHCVFVTGYDAGTFSFISWGQVYKMTTRYWLKYVDEGHTLLSSVWNGVHGAPSGFNLQQLTADLKAIR